MTNIALSSEQTEAVELCADLSKRVVCVTGQAGTGKTTIMREAITETVQHYSNIPFCLAAPTGRAAKRIEEATGIQAVTVHRMMRFSMPKDDEEYGLPAHSRMNPLPYRLVYIDEASMLTEQLRRQVIDALPPGAAIRFFGDVNQLPPVDRPNKQGVVVMPFAQDLKRFPSVTLTHNYRSTDGIISAADAVIKNRLPRPNEKVQMIRVNRGEGLEPLFDLCTRIDFTKVENQIITPTRVNATGATKINLYIQQKHNPAMDKITIFVPQNDGSVEPRSFKRGDKVIWDKNDYELNLFNGTIGYLMDYDKETGYVYVHMDGRDVEVPPRIDVADPHTHERKSYDPRHSLMLAYAITTHKAQGCQFDRVAYVIARSRAATRQNVYTALTRAKEELYIINVGGALSTAISNKQAVE